MSEPKGKARRLVEVVPGVHHWSVSDDRIGGSRSDAYAVVDDDGAVVLIDPLPIDEAKLRELGDITAILLTAGNHQRSAWRFRKELGAPVWAPEDAHGLEDTPDFTYVAGDTLPAGLMPFHTPGPAIAMYTLWMQRHPRGVAFISDLLVHDDKGTPEFVPSEYQDDPLRTRQSVQRILDHLTVDTVCFAHGAPIVRDGAAALRRALEEDMEAPAAPAP
ncbi:MBL fold metallo-hydrolase [Myxococcus sp. K15C18031901]|uniref:MBL fold metallo-hydrolase n=1 Tax=Myxococcus dinghuensis TaxID=2906761 RepID=UPI0020A828E5|nr:MBL fold metallo-hydrolase [Myxococcus dinghuensis]MCP3099686.1 MBL fold metallo-hydrolase [Myxococcus dinghuensis]